MTIFAMYFYVWMCLQRVLTSTRSHETWTSTLFRITSWMWRSATSSQSWYVLCFSHPLCWMILSDMIWINNKKHFPDYHLFVVFRYTPCHADTLFFIFQDVRLIDPNFLKLFKLAQLTIEYLLVSGSVTSCMQNWQQGLCLCLPLCRSGQRGIVIICVHPSVCLSICLCLSVYPSVCLSPSPC